MVEVSISSIDTVHVGGYGHLDEESWWDLRMARHAEFMKLAAEEQIEQVSIFAKIFWA